MDRYFDKSQIKWVWLLISWTLLGLIQAAMTPLLHDEAYYWVFSQELAWGYFDHPPAIAVLIAIGDSIWHHPLGVRLMPVLGSSLAILGMMKLNDWKSPGLLFLLVASTFLAHAGQWIAAPDAALFMSTVIFLLILKKYLQQDSWRFAFGLGVAFALLLYSKYHGSLVIVFCLLPNLPLVKRPSFWAAAILGIFLYLPHLWWEYAHDWPTFQFHLLDRDPAPWSIMRVIEYIGGQLLVLGPLISLPLLWALVKFRAQSSFERTMLWMASGILLFFLAMSFRGRVEANWTASAFIPLLLIGHRFYLSHFRYPRWLNPVCYGSIVILMTARCLLMGGYYPEFSYALRELKMQEKWANRISDIAQDRLVVFYNRYQNASIYRFYTGKNATSYSTVRNWGNQYTVDGSDTLFFDQPAMVFEGWKSKYPRYAMPDGDSISAYPVNHYRQYNFLKATLLNELDSQTDTAVIRVVNSWKPVDIPNDPPTYLGVYMWRSGMLPVAIGSIELSGTRLENDATYLIPVNATDLDETYTVTIGIHPFPLPPLKISRHYR